MAIALSVMNIVDDEKLQENAEMVGNYCLSELKKLQMKHQLIGDVR